ncbi:MAG: DUF454 family protein [Lachnospiraceae bacterium]|nr:DUF454 family protein [Lachnospiraceae bacterium]
MALMIAGIICMIAGLIGLLLPVIPQIPFFVCGTVLLMLGSERFCTWVTSTSLYKTHAKKYIAGNRFLSQLFEKAGLEPETGQGDMELKTEQTDMTSETERDCPEPKAEKTPPEPQTELTLKEKKEDM